MEKNDDNLYEEMERFILYLQEGGADAAQSDELKMLKNPAYHNAFTRSGKIAGRILLIAGGAELLLLAFCFRQDQLLFFLLPLLIWPIFSLALIAFVRKKILARIWICPNCGSRLPLTCSPFSVIIEYVASCPACGANLETESLPSEIPETDDEDGKISDTADQSMTFSPNPEGVVKPPRKWPALLSGIVIILYSLLGLFMTLFYMGDAPSVGIALGIVMHVSILLSGIALLVCRAPKLPEHSRPVICIQERLFVSVLAFIVWPLALFLLLIAFGYCVQPPLDVPFGLIMFLIGLGLLICGIWMLLAGKNRRLYVFENGSLTYMTSWGRKRELLPGQRFSIRFGANDSIQFLNADKKKIFAIERNMRGVDKLADWVESREIPLEITKLKEQQIQQEEGIEPVIQWREEYTTKLHSHLKEIRLGKWLVLALFWAGSIIPLFFSSQELEVQPDHLPDGSFSPSIDCILSGVCACPDTKRKAKRRHCRMAVSPYPHFSPSGFASCIVADVSISLRSGASTDYGRKMVHTGILVWTWRNLYHRLCSSHSKRLRGEGLS